MVVSGAKTAAHAATRRRLRWLSAGPPTSPEVRRAAVNSDAWPGGDSQRHNRRHNHGQDAGVHGSAGGGIGGGRHDAAVPEAQ